MLYNRARHFHYTTDKEKYNMSEEDFGRDEDPEEDDMPDAEEGINAWSDQDIFGDAADDYGWEDSQGTYHEVQYDTPDEDTTELRTTFQTVEEAKDYLYDILYGADQYFEIYYGEDGYSVYYMGGSE